MNIKISFKDTAEKDSFLAYLNDEEIRQLMPDEFKQNTSTQIKWVLSYMPILIEKLKKKDKDYSSLQNSFKKEMASLNEDASKSKKELGLYTILFSEGVKKAVPESERGDKEKIIRWIAENVSGVAEEKERLQKDVEDLNVANRGLSRELKEKEAETKRLGDVSSIIDSDELSHIVPDIIKGDREKTIGWIIKNLPELAAVETAKRSNDLLGKMTGMLHGKDMEEVIPEKYKDTDDDRLRWVLEIIPNVLWLTEKDKERSRRQSLYVTISMAAFLGAFLSFFIGTILACIPNIPYMCIVCGSEVLLFTWLFMILFKFLFKSQMCNEGRSVTKD